MSETSLPDNPLKGEGQTKYDISVIIVSYNTRDVTLRAIEAAYQNSGPVRVEVIVVDNGSSDGSAAACHAEFPQARVIDAKHNGGYAWGNNVGISIARGRYILILNPDTLLHKGTLSRAIKYMDENEKVGLLGAKATYENGEQQSTLFRFPTLRNIAWGILVPNSIALRSSHFGDQRYASQSWNEIMDVDVVAGCFLMVRRTTIDLVGPMDDRFFMYSEETDWCWRMQQSGYKVRYNPGIRITHYGAVSTGGDSPWKAVEIAKGKILFLRFSRGQGVARIATGLMLFGSLLRGAWFIPKMLTSSGRKRAVQWRAQTAFLARALIKQPQGQAPCKIDPSQYELGAE